jgi:hypothetical protein
MEFTGDQLKKAVRDFAFDVWHFRCYVQMHRNATLNGHPTAGQAVRYALLLHRRVLLDSPQAGQNSPRTAGILVVSPL